MPQTPRAAVVVLYKQPTDTAAFERYYDATHVPLVEKHRRELGISDVELTKLSSIDGTAPPFYRKAELWFDSEEAMRRALAMPAFATLADDLPRFATGGVTVLTSVETNA
ncbi:MAG: EthD family reductase [Gemmatimonadaceae bacterium]